MHRRLLLLGLLAVLVTLGYLVGKGRGPEAADPTVAQAGKPAASVPPAEVPEELRISEELDSGQGTQSDLLSPGTYTLRAPNGFQDDSPPPRVPHGRAVLTDLLVSDSAHVVGLELVLPPEGRISGTIVDPPGNAVTEAWIGVIDQRDVSLSARWETRTDATGHFEADNVGPGSYRVLVRTREHETTSGPVLVEAGKTADTRIELR